MGELFSGPGGIALGAQLAAADVPGVALTHAWANDYDADTCSTYRANIRGGRVILKDVRELDIESELTPVDGFAFGFPCNDFSLVGEQKGVDGKFGPLYEYGARVLDRYSPSWFVAENVSGLRSSNDGAALEGILRRLRSAGEHGYRLYPHLYRFEHYGVPQRRHRILIVGIRGDLDVEFQVPSPEPWADVDVSVRTALSDIPGWAENQELTRQSPRVVERLRWIAPGENAFTATLPEELQLNVAGARISQIYRRLHPDKPSYTVTGSGGGGTHVYHWNAHRALTNRERARIQTFPDTFEFRGGKESVRKQIGMAVPVQGARVVFAALFRSFMGVNYPSVPLNMAQLVRSLESDAAADPVPA